MTDYYWKLKVQTGRKYDPGQPRVPAGNPEGGRWTSAGRSPSPTVPPLPKTFKNASVARYWLDMEAFPKKEGKAITGLGLLSDEQVLQVAETVRDLLEKTPHPHDMVKELSIKDTMFCMFDTYKREIVMNPEYNENWMSKRTREEIEDELEFVTPDSSYQHELLSMRNALDSGDYRKLHTLYWFGEGRNLEGIIRHEWGHAFHEVYGRGSRLYGGPKGVDTLYGEGWEEKYGITSRARGNWLECVAENFVAWSTGNTAQMNPEMVKVFNDLARGEG